MKQTRVESSKQGPPDVNVVFSESMAPQEARNRPPYYGNPETSRAAESRSTRNHTWDADIAYRQERYETVVPNVELLKVSQNGFGFYALTQNNRLPTTLDIEMKQEPPWFPDTDTCSDNQTVAEVTLEEYIDPFIMQRMREMAMEQMKEMAFQHNQSRLPIRKRKFDPSQLLTPPKTKVR
jgi:hypothetical protein